MVHLKILGYFNSKHENKSLLVIKILLFVVYQVD